MQNLSWCILAIVVSTLRNLDSSQHNDFLNALKCVSVLLYFSLISQYRSHIPDTPSYPERYLLTFHPTQHICLELPTIKATCTEANCEDQLLELMANEYTHEVHHTSGAKQVQ